MKKQLFILLITASAHCILFSQFPAIEWQNTIGGSGDDIMRCIQQTSDGGYIVGGFSNSPVSGDKNEGNLLNDYWVLKLDNAGYIIWQNTYGGDKDDYLMSIEETNDGGYIAGGWSRSNESADKSEGQKGFDLWILKLDAAGNILWDNTIKGNFTDYLSKIIQTNDNGFLLAGYSASGAGLDKSEVNKGAEDYWIVKLDAAGNILWDKTIGGNLSDILRDVAQTEDGGYVLCGYSSSGISGDKTEVSSDFDAWIVKTDATGNIIWQNTFGGENDEWANTILETDDGGYIALPHIEVVEAE